MGDTKAWPDLQGELREWLRSSDLGQESLRGVETNSADAQLHSESLLHRVLVGVEAPRGLWHKQTPHGWVIVNKKHC